MGPDPPEKLSDARLIGLAARAVRRARNMTAQQVATAMNLPLRTLAPKSLPEGPGHTRRPHRCRGAKM
jgi:hypothetical protein